MSISSDLTDIRTKANGLKSNKITRLAYDQTAYNNNSVASPEHYDWAQHNNIPPQTTTDMKMTSQQIEKGFRLRFPILNKYFFNAFFGRVSYNLNKLTDFFYSLVDSLVSALGAPNGLATLDANGRLPASQATETLMSFKGAWSASTNTPHLSDGMSGAVKGDMYIASDTGTVTFGTGNTVSFLPDDRVVYDGAKWCRWSAGNVRRVCELLPDGNGNIDLTQQADIYKVLNKKIIGELFYWGIGRKWVQCTGGETVTFRGATYGNGIWVAFSTSHGLWWSEDGKSWTQSSTSGVTSLSFRFAYYLNGIWIAGGDSAGCWWSTDGKTWTSGTGISVGADSTRHCIYANGLYILTGRGMWWSTDGKSWTQGTGANTSYNMNTVSYNNGLFVACSTGHGMWWSTDGKAWTQGTGGTTNTFYKIAYGNGVYVTCGNESALQGCWYSTDGKNWAQGAGNTTGRMFTVTYANGLFVAGSWYDGIWYSTDGVNWTQGNGISTTYAILGVKYANSIWLAGTATGGLYLSNDGKVWWQISALNFTDYIPFIQIGFFEGMFVIGTTTGLWYSDWTTIE